MKISESWLREWVNPPISTETLVTQLTMAGLEVDAVEPVAGAFSGVIIARVVATRPHPQAERLTLCEVDSGQGARLTVVCGARNVRPGLVTALATLGAILPGDLVIKEARLRGELSQGMLCAASELGLVDASEGIMELPDDAPLGMDIRTFLLLDDQVLDLDLTPNRADCLSVQGLAREIAALNQLPMPSRQHEVSAATIESRIPVHLSASEACPFYAGRLLTGINPDALTPLLIQERLRRSGIRCSHPVVDVLNYLMLALGQPMHAFDHQAMHGDIDVRLAKPEESITLLNGQTVVLDPRILLIADQQNPLAIAGVMGSEASAVKAGTTAIWIEAAYFEPVAIAGLARRFGLSSEAAHRYERGIDPNATLIALEAATTLLQTIVGGEIGPVVCAQSPSWPPATRTIVFHPEKLERLTGVHRSDQQISQALQALGMSLECHPSHWEVNVPSYRRDLSIEVDLVEEVIRLFGYDQIPAAEVASVMRPGKTDAIESLGREMMQFLAHRNYHETISYSFVDPQLQRALYPEAQVMSLLNPISSELAEMRVGLWPGLLASMLHNLHRQQLGLKLAEIGKVFRLVNDDLMEISTCAALMTGEYGQFNCHEHSDHYDFYDMKGDVEALCADLGLRDIQFIANEHPALHPGKTAEINYKGQVIGWMGALHPRLLNALDLNQEVFLFEIEIPPLLSRVKPLYQRISKYPFIRRDLSLCVNEETAAAELERVARETLDPRFLKSFYVFDVYTDAALAQQRKKSIAIGMVLQDDKATLQDADIQEMMAALIRALETQLSASLRTA